jgi:predicted Zn-dependent peptidase
MPDFSNIIYEKKGRIACVTINRPQRMNAVDPATSRELRKLLEEPVGAEEMTKVRDYSVGSFRLSPETPMALGQRAGGLLLTMGEIEPVESVVEKVQAITADDVLRVARRIVQTDKLVLAVVGPDVESEELAELLATTAA